MDENEKTSIPPEPVANKAEIRNGVMTVTIHLDRSDSAFAESIGSLELAKDLCKNYFMQKQMREAVIRKSNGIIKPGIVGGNG